MSVSAENRQCVLLQAAAVAAGGWERASLGGKEVHLGIHGSKLLKKVRSLFYRPLPPGNPFRGQGSLLLGLRRGRTRKADLRCGFGGTGEGRRSREVQQVCICR